MISINYFGHSAFSVTNEAKEVLLVDPYISGNPHCSISVADLKQVNTIAVSHASFDHLGDAYDIMKQTGARLICSFDVEIDARRKGFTKDQVKHITYGQVQQEGGMSIKALLAFHTSRFDYGTSFLTGQPLSLLLRPDDRTTIWYGGDTCIFGDMKMYGELFKPNVVVIGIGGRLSRQRAEMSIEEAAIATQWLHPQIVIPVHYHHGADDPEVFREAVKGLAPDIRVAALKPGEVLKFGE